MSIKDIGYVDFFNHKCIYIQDDMKLLIVPSNEKDNILPLAFKSDYQLTFTDSLKQTGIASVKKGFTGITNYIELELNYIAKAFHTDLIDEFTAFWQGIFQIAAKRNFILKTNQV